MKYKKASITVAHLALCASLKIQKPPPLTDIHITSKARKF